MDINDARAIVTVVSLLVFLGIVAWAWNGRRKASFEEAAQLPLIDDSAPPPAVAAGRKE